MPTLLCNIYTCISLFYPRELMLSCAIINVLGFFDLSFQYLNEDLYLTRVLILTKYSDLIKTTPRF